MTKSLHVPVLLLAMAFTAGCRHPRAVVIEAPPPAAATGRRSAGEPATPATPQPEEIGLRDPDVVSELPGEAVSRPQAAQGAAGGGTVIAQPPPPDQPRE